MKMQLSIFFRNNLFRLSRKCRSFCEGRRWFRPFHSFYVGLRARCGGHINWPKQLNIGSSALPLFNKKDLSNGQSVLIATSIAGHLPSAAIEGLLGIALQARGSRLDYLLCDGTLTACMICESRWYRDSARFAEKGPEDHCAHCFSPGYEALQRTGAAIKRYSEFIDEEKRSFSKALAESTPIDKIQSLVHDGIPIGEHAMAGTLRFFARGELEGTAEEEAVLRVYLQSAFLTYFSALGIMSANQYDVLVLHHGIYIPQGIIAAVAKKKGVRVVTWHPAYREGCFIFSHRDTYHRTLIDEPVSNWENLSWSTEREDELMAYLDSRWVGSEDWINFQEASLFSSDEVAETLGVDRSLPCIGLLTNVFWDAQIHYPDNAYSNMLEWIIDTIDYFKSRPDIQLLIRVHPAEINGNVPSRQKIANELSKRCGQLPSNVYIIPPESKISTYAAMMFCDSVLIYGTKMGVELTSRGTPVIVVGEAWIKGKGITFDVSSRESYIDILNQLPLGKKLSGKQLARARKYAYHFFFRRMIPIEFVRRGKRFLPYKINVAEVDGLLPGKSRGLDIICDGILNGTPFVYPAEEGGF